ncbi:PhnA domain-containing protein [Kiloniella sp. b19]|uniref:PhnA domain-containing protein n=1 Tax=Kiloniella sp. GXU_MW_B19 TaxID=3141326 RepID=UPI0031E059E0
MDTDALETMLTTRSNTQCELCGASGELGIKTLTDAPENLSPDEASFLVCPLCEEGLGRPDLLDEAHWGCLSTSMWSTVPAVQVSSARVLKALSRKSWAQDLLDMLYLEPELQLWADSKVPSSSEEIETPHRDSNGAILEAGDSVVLIKDLPVKGAGFTAKRGTAVRNISLVPGNPEQIEGRVNNQQIVLLTRFVRKN